MFNISLDMLLSLKRKRGELNMKISDLSRETHLSRFTLYRIFNDQTTSVNRRTFNNLSNWLEKHNEEDK